MSLRTESGQQQIEELNLNCSVCQNPPAGNTTSCIQCHKIFHKDCINVTNDTLFKCLSCSSIRPNSPTLSTTSHRSNRSRLSQSQRIDLQLQRLEEERKLNQQLNNDYLNKKYQLLEEAETVSDILSEKSQTVHNWVASVNSRSQELTLNKDTNNNSAQQTSSLPNQTNNIAQNTHNAAAPAANQPTTTCIGSSVPPQNHVTFVKPTPPNVALTSSLPLYAVSNCATNIPTYSGLKRMQPSISTATRNQQNVFLPSSALNNNNTSNFFPQNPPQFISHQPITSTMNFNQTAQTPLTFSQPQSLSQTNLNSRQSLPKELPLFSGQPEEWPIFISTYEWSNVSCAFTNEENLIRLQKALKGEALHSVKHMLIHPSNVPDVIHILYLLFGQPEKIINSIKHRIKLSPKVDENNIKTLTSMAVEVRSLITTITASNLHHELNNSSLLHDLIQKLPSMYQMQWATQKMQLINQNNTPNLYEFDKWFFNIGITASSITVDHHSRNKLSAENKTDKNTTTNKRVFLHTQRSCIVCNNNNCNTITKCKKFHLLDRGEKWNIIRKYNLCKFCLLKHSGDCNKRKKCGEEGCEYFHHPLLHRYSDDTKKQIVETNKKEEQTMNEEVSFNNTHSEEQLKEVLFKVIPIKIYGKYKEINTFAFIDEGSSISLIDESLANDLDLDGEQNPLCLRWTGGMERSEENSKKLKINISGGNRARMAINVSTVKSLNLPVQTMDYRNLSQRYRHLRNLPIESYKDAVPQVLIGLNHFDLGVPSKIREGSPLEPIAARTKLGWCIYGAVGKNNTSRNCNFQICNCTSTVEELDQLIRNFYSLEAVIGKAEIRTKTPLESNKDKRAVEILNKFTKQKRSGHYEVPLLWKFDLVELPPSYDMALKRLICLERKLKVNSELFSIFKETISKYLAKGYIRKLNSFEIDRADKKVWYLPIFAVFNKNKPGKSRVVWDAAAKANGVSLNSFLLKGPDYLASLPSILFKFRQKSVAVCGDIEEMFHQVHIRPEDRDVQRFLWRDCQQDKSPDIYVMDVMIFGASCAPCISQYIKNLNASKFENEFPLAAKAIKENHYVDDFLDSVDNSEEASKLISEVSHIHLQAGFNIRNWISNDKLALRCQPPAENVGAKCINIKEENPIEKVLGIFWEHQEDVLTFKVSPWLMKSDIFLEAKIPTKREVLRLVMSIYDPLGLIGHITMYVKILLQDVWRSNIDWDDKISQDLFSKWSKWINILPDIAKIKIPRCYLKSFQNYNNIEVQLHTFVDASKDGYAAVCYFRLKKGESIICSIVGAKTRVAPMKITSVPRLELMAALVGSRFAKYVTENHTIKISKKIYWTDSKTVLSWINSDHRKYNQFVAFRITEILELSSTNEWRWIPSKLNVADDATKWSKIPNISNCSRWFQGPEFLHHSEHQWPQSNTPLEPTKEECVKHLLKITKSDVLFDVLRFSKWKRLLRTAAYVLRFICNCRNTFKQRKDFTQEELLKAEKILYMQAQSEKYYNEIILLKSSMLIPKSSDIFNRNPYLDDGLLRVQGRIDNAEISFEQKRPIILPQKHYITKLILLNFHEKFYHINQETAINEIRQKYSISKLRTTFKSVIRQCQRCKMQKATPQNPQMAILPRARVASFVAPFTYTGIDFFGPIFVTVNRHQEKRYGCLFTCLSIRAVHIEIAHSLTTTSCILAIRNFMARRGIPREFYSDNGTNFVGAERELREALAEVDKDEIVKTFTTTTTKWNFNPPSSPHMGGAWERLVRSIKTTLYQISPSRSPSDELLRSMITEVENIINSRPLTYIPVDGESGESLTPNHFLLGSSSGLKPMSTCNDSGILLKKSWLISQQYANIFWKRWLSEYLTSLTYRTKWHNRQKPLSQGDLVIIVDPSSPRNVWLRGKVLEARLAKDGQVRSAKVLTANGILERPVNKLAVLDVSSHEQEYADEGSSCHTVEGNVADTGKNC